MPDFQSNLPSTPINWQPIPDNNLVLLLWFIAKNLCCCKKSGNHITYIWFISLFIYIAKFFILTHMYNCLGHHRLGKKNLSYLYNCIEDLKNFVVFLRYSNQQNNWIEWLQVYSNIEWVNNRKFFFISFSTRFSRWKMELMKTVFLRISTKKMIPLLKNWSLKAEAD